MEYEHDALAQAEKIINEASFRMAHEALIRSFMKKLMRDRGLLEDEVEDT